MEADRKAWEDFPLEPPCLPMERGHEGTVALPTLHLSKDCHCSSTRRTCSEAAITRESTKKDSFPAVRALSAATILRPNVGDMMSCNCVDTVTCKFAYL